MPRRAPGVDDEETLDGRLLDQSLYELTIEPARSGRRVASIDDMPVIGYERFDSSATTPCSPSLLEKLCEEARYPDGPPPISGVRATPASKGPPPIPADAKRTSTGGWIARLLGGRS